MLFSRLQQPGRWRWWLLAGGAAAVLGWMVFPASDDVSRPGDPMAGAGTGQAAASAPAVAANSPDDPAMFGANARAAREQQRALWSARYESAAQTYNTYRDATRYPHESRPLAEHPDQVRPFEPVSVSRPMRDAQGKPSRGIQLRTTQDRIFLSGNEAVRFTIQAFDENGRALPLVVSNAVARSIPDGTALMQITETQLAFANDGQSAEATAGRYSAMLVPQTQGFAAYAGTIRVLAQVEANGQPGVAQFEVAYQPLVPATWAGGVREVIEDGSLQLYLKANVAVAGRYVVTGRVFDAANQPLALVQFNDEVRDGLAEFRLTLFGALLRDKSPKFPLRLVDVDAFLLQPDTFPDRAMMARRPGVVHVTGMYSPDRFSADEWQSEERQRHLAEFARDVTQAQRAIDGLQGGR